MNVDQPKATLTVTRHIAAPAEAVFDAWLDPETARRFLFATPEGEMITANIDPRVGGQFLFIDLRAGVEIVHVGEYRRIERPSCLVFTFAVPQFSEEFTEVEVDIRSSQDECELTLVHRDVLSDWVESSREGWEKILANLAECVEAR
jgi:uncharacterized protein YndB with AHSA1/START domain